MSQKSMGAITKFHDFPGLSQISMYSKPKKSGLDHLREIFLDLQIYLKFLQIKSSHNIAIHQ